MTIPSPPAPQFINKFTMGIKMVAATDRHYRSGSGQRRRGTLSLSYTKGWGEGGEAGDIILSELSLYIIIYSINQHSQ